MHLSLALRRQVFDAYGNREIERTSDLPPDGVRFSCPCCGYPTLNERGAFQICRLCWWEDDGQDDRNADQVLGGPNHGYSLLVARTNFENYLVMYPPEFDTRISGPESETTRSLKRRLIAAYDSMIGAETVDSLNRIWKEIDRMEKGLYKILRETIRAYEASVKE